MMRRYHRWLSIMFGVFLLWISATGMLSQDARMIAAGEPQAAGAPAGGDGDEAARPADAAAPADAARPPQTPLRAFIHEVTELHSGEALGPVGQAISLLSGLALFFFAGSGLWMYIELFRGRMVRVRDGKPVRGGKFFWR